MKKKTVYNLVTASMLFALGLVLPLLTGQIREIGNMLLPMHLPVLLCGFICGWRWGIFVGASLPIIRSLIFGMPLLFPSAVTMAFELCAYGFVTGFLYCLFKRKNVIAVYLSLIPAMIIGRIVKGVANAVCYGIINKGYSFTMFIYGAFLEAIPGIILQLILIPAILIAIKKTSVK